MIRSSVAEGEIFIQTQPLKRIGGSVTGEGPRRHVPLASSCLHIKEVDGASNVEEEKPTSSPERRNGHPLPRQIDLRVSV